MVGKITIGNYSSSQCIANAGYSVNVIKKNYLVLRLMNIGHPAFFVSLRIHGLAIIMPLKCFIVDRELKPTIELCTYTSDRDSVWEPRCRLLALT